MQLQGVLQNFRKRLAGRDRMPGRRSASWMVFVMLAMRKVSYEAHAAFIPGGITR